MANSRNVWQKVFAGTWLGEARSVRETKDKGYICTGYTVSERRTDFDIKVVKLDASGNLVWEKTFGGEFHERSYSVQQTSDGGYVVAGYTMSFGAGGRDVYVLKTRREWQHVVGKNIRWIWRRRGTLHPTNE